MNACNHTTVMRDWTTARAWLFATLSGENMDAI